MKYIDADKLIAGIKHLQEKFPVATYGALYYLITSLQQERPEVDLEKEIERIVKNEEKFMKFQARHQLIGYVARHFAKWGATHLK